MKVSKVEAIIEIQRILSEGNEVLELNISADIDLYVTRFNEWREGVIKSFKIIFVEESLALRFEAETIYLEHSFSKFSTKSEISKAVKCGMNFIKRVFDDISSGVYRDKDIVKNTIPKEIAMIIIIRIMENFYKHIEVMYQDPVHGRAKILKTDLDKIRIGNEYDVQRILYSIIKPIFPLARVEVSEDAGYNSVRYDIYIDEYDIVIEVKCTRDSMNERKLTEELGSDIFHYKANNLFFFIYDKEKIIKNVDAFTKTYTKKEETLNKIIETVVIQPIVL